MPNFFPLFLKISVEGWGGFNSCTLHLTFNPPRKIDGGEKFVEVLERMGNLRKINEQAGKLQYEA